LKGISHFVLYYLDANTTKTKKNVRVLYTIVDGDIILLHAFLEKNDSDYRRGINLSNKRLDELEE
jgi:phage-related protein